MKVTKEFLILRHASYPGRFLAATVDQMDAHLATNDIFRARKFKLWEKERAADLADKLCRLYGEYYKIETIRDTIEIGMATEFEQIEKGDT